MRTRTEQRGETCAGSARKPASALPSWPKRPTLTLKDKATSPSRAIASAGHPTGPVGIASEEAPALNKTEAAQARSKKPYRPWSKERGPVPAQAVLLERSQTINALLEAPIGVLPAKLGEVIRPFRVGVGPEIIARRRLGVPVTDCEKALRDYARSFAYRLAIAQPGSMRHDIDGNPVEPVSDADREHAQRSILTTQERSRQRKAQRMAEETASAVSAEPSRTSGPSAHPVPSGPADN